MMHVSSLERALIGNPRSREPETNLAIVTPPAEELLRFADIEAQLRLFVDDEKQLIEGTMIPTAREVCELWARRAFLTQTLRLTLDAWPDDCVIHLRRPPIQSVTSVVYVDDNGTSHTLAASKYVVDLDGQRVYIDDVPSATLQQIAGVRVTYVAGYGDSAEDVPARYIQAAKLLVGHYYENREAVVVGQGFSALEVPLAVRFLLMLDRGSYH